MKTRILPLVWLGAICLSLLVAGGTAEAYPNLHAYGQHHWNRYSDGGDSHPRAPELDPSLTGSGLAILGASVLLLTERYRRRR